MGVELPSSGSDSEGKCQKKKGGKWRKQRALAVAQSADVIEGAPGETVNMSFTFKNNTKAPWKQGCYLSYANCHKNEKNQKMAQVEDLPIEMVKIPVEFDVAGETEHTLQVPITVAEHAVADEKLWNIKLKFRGPGGKQFGKPMKFTLRVNFPEKKEETSQPKVEASKDEFEVIQKEDPIANFYKAAVKLHEQTSVSFDEVCKVLKQYNCDGQAALEALQRN